MPVVFVGGMRVGVVQCRVRVNVGMPQPSGRRRRVRMGVVLVVNVGVGVDDQLVNVPVDVLLPQEKHKAENHQGGASVEHGVRGRGKQGDRQDRSGKRGRREHGSSSGGPQVAKPVDEEGDARAIADRPDGQGGQGRRDRRQGTSETGGEPEREAAGDEPLDRGVELWVAKRDLAGEVVVEPPQRERPQR